MKDRAGLGSAGRAGVVLGTALLVAALVVAVVGALLAVWWVAQAANWGLLGPVVIAQAVVVLLAGVVLGLVLWALAAALGRQQRNLLLLTRVLSNLESLNDRLDLPAPAARAERGQQAPPEDLLREVVEQLAELNSSVLLDDTQREAKRQQRLAAVRERLGERFEAALARRDFASARASLTDLARLEPDSPLVEQWRQRIDAARAEAQAQDVRQAHQRCQELLKAGQVDQAQAVADGLLVRHPHAAQAAELVGWVKKQAGQVLQEQRRTLFAQVEKLAADRQWRQALASAQDLLNRYPDTPEAQVVTARMDTLRDNARIEEVREKRDAIRDLIGRRRFPQALELAEDVVRRFPETTAAAELRDQLDRLRERAAEQG